MIGNPKLREISSKVSDFGEDLQKIIQDPNNLDFPINQKRMIQIAKEIREANESTFVNLKYAFMYFVEKEDPVSNRLAA